MTPTLFARVFGNGDRCLGSPTMRRMLFLAAALMCIQPALADDWTDDSVEARHSGWSGGYLTGFGGLGVTAGNARLHDYSGALLTLDVTNGLFPQDISGIRTRGLVGAAAGYNFQSGKFVGGVEVDIGYSWAKATLAYSRVDPGPIFPGVNTNTTYGTEFGTLGSARIRAGYDLGDTLLYATGGIAAGQVRNSLTLALPELGYSSPDWSKSGVRFGYAVGIGVEHKLASNVSLRLETLFMDLDDQTVDATDSATFPGEAFSYRFSNTLVMPRVGLTLKF